METKSCRWGAQELAAEVADPASIGCSDVVGFGSVITIHDANQRPAGPSQSISIDSRGSSALGGATAGDPGHVHHAARSAVSGRALGGVFDEALLTVVITLVLGVAGAIATLLLVVVNRLLPFVLLGALALGLAEIGRWLPDVRCRVRQRRGYGDTPGATRTEPPTGRLSHTR